jgi:hypothetical protein
VVSRASRISSSSSAKTIGILFDFLSRNEGIHVFFCVTKELNRSKSITGRYYAENVDVKSNGLFKILRISGKPPIDGLCIKML